MPTIPKAIKLLVKRKKASSILWEKTQWGFWLTRENLPGAHPTAFHTPSSTHRRLIIAEEVPRAVRRVPGTSLRPRSCFIAGAFVAWRCGVPTRGCVLFTQAAHVRMCEFTCVEFTRRVLQPRLGNGWVCRISEDFASVFNILRRPLSLVDSVLSASVTLFFLS